MNQFSPQLIDHFTNPRNLGEMDGPCVRAIAKNPVCGDQIHLFARLHRGRVSECSFLAYGCAAALATGSLLTEAVRGLHLDEIATLTETQIARLAGGYTPNQMHCAHVAAAALAALVEEGRRARCDSDVPADAGQQR